MVLNYLENFERTPLYLAYRLVEEGKIDPWDVDLERLINSYLEEIRRIELRDLRVPALLLAFATFLIKKQLEILFPKPPRRRERRKITLKEIEREFSQTSPREIILTARRKIKRSRTLKGKRVKSEPPASAPLHKALLEEVLPSLLALVEELKEGQKLPFREFAGKKDYVAKFWGLLNLAYEGKVDLIQEGGQIYFGKGIKRGSVDL